MNMPNTPTYIFYELRRRKIPVEVINDKARLIRYKIGDTWHFVKGCITEAASTISCSVCDNKTLTEYFAKQVGLRTPPSIRYKNDTQAMTFIQKHTSVVVKPIDAAHGHGISLNVRTSTALKRAIKAVRVYSDNPAIIQKMIYGDDLRLLLIGGRFVAAVRRVPASVVGDGKHTIAELIEKENALPHRVTGVRGELKVINVQAAKAFLKKRINAIPSRGQRVAVVGVSNTSMGGHAEDATDDVPDELRQKAEAFAGLLKLPVCGIDVMMEKNGTYYFIEANARPGFGPHHHPRIGKKRDVTKIFVDHMLQTTEGSGSNAAPPDIDKK